MARIAVARLLGGLTLVVLLTFATFAVANAIPQNKACMFVDCKTATRAEMKDALHQHGFDEPIVTQYARFAWRVIRHGSFGRSWNGLPLDSIIRSSLPVSASVVVGGLLLTLAIALPLGILGATRPRSLLDRTVLTTSLTGLAVHPFVLGIGVAAALRRLGSPSGSYCPLTHKAVPGLAFFPGGSASFGAPRPCGGPVDWATHLAGPWLVFALLFSPIYVRMFRTQLLTVMSERYVETARAKGASEPRVVLVHALRSAIGPILPMLALDAGTAITAVIYIETIFGLPGLGYLAVQGLSGEFFEIHYDLPFIVAIFATIGVFIVVLNTLADVAHALLDPRART